MTAFITLLRHETFRFMRLVRQTVFPPIITTGLFIIIFGFSLGSRIQEIEGVPYILYIIPGLVAMSVMNNAFTNTSFAVYSSRFDQSLDNMLVAPLRPVELVAAFVWGGIARGLLIGAITLAIALLLLHQSVQHLGITLFFLLLQCLFFGCWGIIAALRAKTWDNLATTQTFLITPLTYLGGVFYSIDLLPPFWKKISLFNPFFYMVDGTRYGILGIHDAPIGLAAALTVLISLLMFALCVYLFQIGYKIVK